MKLNCIAVDDEPLALDIIRTYSEKIPFLELKKTFDNAIDVAGYLNTAPADLMFLDIQMEDLSGIQLLNVLKSRPKVIVTTAYDSYALDGYDLDVTDYLLKPFSFERFLKAVTRVYELISLEHGNSKQPALPSPSLTGKNEDFFFVKTEFRLQRIDFSDILYIEGQGDYLAIATTKGKIMTLQNFSRMEKVLPSPGFIRVHKSYIVPLSRIDRVEKNRIKIGDKTIPVSDTYKNRFFEALEKKGLM